MVSTTTITALKSTLTATVARGSNIVNDITTYTFTIVTIDKISSAGKIKIVFPSKITIITSAAACAVVSGIGMTVSPNCIINLA